MRKSCPAQVRGFTLVEVLVVIVIIGVLAAILFPVLAKSKLAAEKANCLNNSRQLALAAVMYEQDNNDRLFPYGYWSGLEYLTWWGDLQSGEPDHSFLFPYTKSGQIRACPSAIDLVNEPSFNYRMGYGMNFRLFFAYPPEPETGVFRTVSATEIDRPAETILCSDAARYDTSSHLLVSFPWLFGDGWNVHLQGRHLGEIANVTWLDGHASGNKLYFHTFPMGDGTNMISPDTLRANSLGDLLKFPPENPELPYMTIRDQYYYLLQKQPGT